MSNETASGDSNELEALFDSIASGVSAPRPVAFATPQPAPVAAPAPAASLMRQVREGDSLSEDNDDLQALFDSVASKPQAGAAAAVQDTDWAGQEKVFNQVGQMARLLHDTLGALGYDKLLEKTVHALPDAKDRLTYIANLTEQAACKVLNATDIANPLQEELENGAKLLADKWDAVYANRLSTQEFKLLADETRAYLKNAVPQRTGATREQLMEIMMAQDFQDLTGQVIKKIVGLAQDLESGLMNVLIETMPGEKKTESVKSLLNGPVVNPEGRTDVVASQKQVDDLLDSLGF
ncbi:MAG: protein phosphatase CheZ [Propionivibrio sp.]